MMTKEEENRIITLFANGHTPGAIAVMCKKSDNIIRRFLERHNVQVAMINGERVLLPHDFSPVGRCPKCGRKVCLPCIACLVKPTKNPPLSYRQPPNEDLKIDLVNGDEERFLEARAMMVKRLKKEAKKAEETGN